MARLLTLWLCAAIILGTPLAALGPLGARAAALELLARESVVAAFETYGEHGDRR